MPNKNSNKGHIPRRSCVVCRKKDEKRNLLRFVIIEGEIVFDMKQKLQQRGYYVCNENGCIIKLAKWRKKKKLKI